MQIVYWLAIASPMFCFCELFTLTLLGSNGRDFRLIRFFFGSNLFSQNGILFGFELETEILQSFDLTDPHHYR